MSKPKQKHSNQLTRYRERLGFTQEQLAHIVGCSRAQTIWRIESGITLPGIMTALRLSAALRIPVEFLYRDTFHNLREEVRANEEKMARGTQGVLPLST